MGWTSTTTNGGVHLEVPANYSARLETSTVNGGMHADYPLTGDRQNREEHLSRR